MNNAEPSSPAGKKKKGLTHSTLVGFFWSFAGTGGQALLQFLVLAALSRLLTPAENGLVNVANTFVAFSGLFYQAGIGPALIQRQTLTEAHIRSGFTFTLLSSLTLTVLLWFLAPVFAGFFPFSGLTEIIRGLSFVFVINGVGLVARSLNYRDLNFRIKARFNIVSYAFGYGLVGITLAFLGFGAWALVWAALAQATAYTTLFLVASPHDKRPQLDRRALADLLTIGTGFTLGQVFNRIANNSDNLIVAATLGDRAVGLYGRAYTLFTLPSQYFGQVLDTVLFTSMSKVQDQTDTLARVYLRGTVAIALVVMPLSAFLGFLAPEFVYVLLGGQWDAIVVPFQIFSVTMFFRTSYKMGDSLCRSAGVVFQRAFRQFVFSLLIIAASWFGHYQGIVGVTVGVSLVIVINFLSATQLSLKVTNLGWGRFARVHLPALLLTGVVAAETAFAATFLRGVGLPDLLTLLLAAGFVGATLLALVWAAPRRFLGQDGLWILETLSGYLPRAVRARVSRLQYR